VRSSGGGIVIRPTDFNPERIILDDSLTSTPKVNVGDTFTTPVLGIIDYSFGNFKLQTVTPLEPVSGGLEREVAAPAGAKELSVATSTWRTSILVMAQPSSMRWPS
jgi:hypothetical protein